MKKLSILAALVLLFVLSGCYHEHSAFRTNSPESYAEDLPQESSTLKLFSPYDAEKYYGMDYLHVEQLFRDAGFVQITYSPIDDIDSSSEIHDGSIESVAIDGIVDYTSSSGFDRNASVCITYHNIPKIAAPISSDAATAIPYMDTGKRFFDAGFAKVETEEVYDLKANEKALTSVTANGMPIESSQALPFDSEIRAIGHFPISSYPVKITIDFEANWIFSKYDVIAMLNGMSLGTMKHGEGTSVDLQLPAGDYKVSFQKDGDDDVSGSADFHVDSETNVTYHISCHRNRVDVEEKDFSHALGNDSLFMPYSSDHYLRKNYQKVITELKELGFRRITAIPTPENLWLPPTLNTVVNVTINGNSAFDHDSAFRFSDPVNVYYHVADFRFLQSEIRVTEKDDFELEYSLSSGDDIASFSYEIDHPDIVRRNDDGSFTALKPGNATVTVTDGSNRYSSCYVEVDEIVVPIERVVFSSENIYAIVGSSIRIDYSYYPENANYTDTIVEITNPDILAAEGDAYFVNEAGDAEFKIYQDDRLLGSCVIHAEVIEIESLVFEECAEELVIGERIEYCFSILPDNATLRGIEVASSNPQIVEAFFDDRVGNKVMVTGVSVGNAEILIAIPNGTQYTFPVSVKEVVPTEISITNIKPDAKIEVGTLILLDARWKPENTSDKDLKWSSSNAKVIRINTDGSIEAVGLGTAVITAAHKSGVCGTITLEVEPTPVKSVEFVIERNLPQDFVKGDSFTIAVSVYPENATDQSITYTSGDTSVVTVSKNGVVTAVGAGTTTITASSADGPQKTMTITVGQSPQKFRISYSAQLLTNNHVGYSWSKTFEVNNEVFYSGNSITIAPDSEFSVCLTIQENDTVPDTGSYYKKFKYSDDLCKNGYSESGTIVVRENRGRYSGNTAEWSFTVSIIPIA